MRHLVLFLSLLFTWGIALAQVQVPTRALLNFKHRYERATEVTWADTIKNQLAVKFTHVDEQKIAFFDRNGNWLKTHIFLQPDQLMYCIRDHILEGYPDYETREAFAISSGVKLTYFAVLARKESTTDIHSAQKVVSYSNKCEFISEE